MDKVRSVHPTNLPTQLTGFIGRDQELQAITNLLLKPQVRFLTLLGPGGIGKTRLALQAAELLASSFRDGCIFVPLEAVRDSEEVVGSLIGALRIVETGGQSPLKAVKTCLQSREVLLLVDNFEQVMSAAPLLGCLLMECPLTKFLVTSRSSLRLQAEWQFDVPPMSLPNGVDRDSSERLYRYDAVRLFVERARTIMPEFTLNEVNIKEVLALCRHLDGLPLSIELAAARTKFISPTDMLLQMGRLDLISSGPIDAPYRHRSIRDTIAWSHALLNEKEKILFRRLSVFARSFSLSAAQVVCNLNGDIGFNVLDVIDSLLHNSLLSPVQSSGFGPRFHMLETVREYGIELLRRSGELDGIQFQHTKYFLGIAERFWSGFSADTKKKDLDHIEHEHDNFRVAIRWSLESKNSDMALALAGALSRFWRLRGYLTEGRYWLHRAISTGGAGNLKLRARAMSAAAALAGSQSDYCEARRLSEFSLEIYRQLDDKAGIAAQLNKLGIMSARRGDYLSAIPCLAESATLYRNIGNMRGTAVAIGNLGMTAFEQGDYDEANKHFLESLRIYQGLDNTLGIAHQCHNLAVLLTHQGKHHVALDYCERSLRAYRTMEHREGTANVLEQLGVIAFHKGNLVSAEQHYREALVIRRELGDKEGMVRSLERMASLAGELQQQELAVKLMGSSAVTRIDFGVSVPPVEISANQRLLAAAREALGAEQFSAAWAIGQATALDEAADLALVARYEALPIEPVPTAAKPQSVPPAATDGHLMDCQSAQLSKRENEVCHFIAQGYTNAQIAVSLTLSERTIETHVSRILRKLGLSSRSQIAVWTVKNLPK